MRLRPQVAIARRRLTRQMAHETLEHRAMLASLNVEYRFEIQTHDVLFGYDHLSILASPIDQSNFSDSDGDGFADQDCLFSLQADGNFGLSFGAGPTRFVPLAHGNLIGGLNRDSDIDSTLHPPANKSLISTIGSGVESTHSLLDTLLRRSLGYNNSLPYPRIAFQPGGGTFNSNSYIAGLLNTVSVAPQQHPDALFAGTDHAGFEVPVPPNHFPLHPTRKERVDLVLVVDSTGSMADDIQAVKSASSRIIQQLHENSIDARVAVVSFRDHPPQDRIAFETVQNFSCSAGIATQGINGITVSGGGDTPEALFGALSYAMDANGLGLWRGGTVGKKIIYMTDAPPHSPEPVTGLTIADIIRQANSGGIVVENRSGEGESTSLDAEAPIQIFPVIIGNNAEAISVGNQLAEATGGAFFQSQDANDLVDTLVSAIVSATGGDQSTEFKLQSDGLRVGPNRLELLNATPGAVTALVRGSGVGVTSMDTLGVTLDVADAQIVAQAVVQPDGRAHLLFHIKDNAELNSIRLQAFEQAPELRITNVLSGPIVTGESASVSSFGSSTSTANVGELALIEFIVEDVNGDGVVSPLDALTVLNHLSLRGAEGEGLSDDQQRLRERLDVNKDGLVSPLDALLVLNYLSRRSAVGGEGEAFLSKTNSMPNSDEKLSDGVDDDLLVMLAADVSRTWFDSELSKKRRITS